MTNQQKVNILGLKNENNNISPPKYNCVYDDYKIECLLMKETFFT